MYWLYTLAQVKKINELSSYDPNQSISNFPLTRILSPEKQLMELRRKRCKKTPQGRNQSSHDCRHSRRLPSAESDGHW